MTTLVAVLLANADGRTARMMAALLDVRSDRVRIFALYFTCFALLSAISAAGAMLASRSLGLGMLNLMAAIALGSAAIAIMMPHRVAWGGTAARDDPPMRMFIRFTAGQIGDRNQCLILGLGALSGAAPWAMAGASAGLLIAFLPVAALGPALVEGRRGRWLRWLAAAVLTLWALLCLGRAFGV